jgi:hypothetical protein
MSEAKNLATIIGAASAIIAFRPNMPEWVFTLIVATNAACTARFAYILNPDYYAKRFTSMTSTIVSEEVNPLKEGEKKENDLAKK